MPNLKFTLEVEGDTKNLTVYQVPYYDKPLICDDTHVAWDQILAGVLNDDLAVIDLINIIDTLQREIVSERVSIAAGKLFFDGDEVTDALGEYILKLIAQGDASYTAFVAFMEKVYSNPQEHSRQHLFDHIQKYNMTITPDGDLVLYKGVFYTKDKGSPYADKPEHPLHNKTYVSGSAGPAIINGQPHKEGVVPQDIGDTVEIPRSDVSGAPGTACSLGLHVATWGYWHTNYGPTIAVLVNPRDVVSVPHDDAKIRCCRYKLIGEVKEPYKGAVVNIKVPTAAGRNRPVVFATTEPAEKVDPVTDYQYPSKIEWENACARARAQKKGLRNYVGKKWTLIDPDTDGSDRKHWSTV